MKLGVPLSCCFCPLILTPTISSSCASFQLRIIIHMHPLRHPFLPQWLQQENKGNPSKSCALVHIHLKMQFPEKFQFSKFYGCTLCRSTHKNTLTLILRESRRCLGTWWSILNAASCHSQELNYSADKPFQSHFVVVTNINLGVTVSVQDHL